MDTSTTQTWRSILQRVLKVPGERQRLAASLGLSSMTLVRWANGETTPQRIHLMRLVQVVNPLVREELLEALEMDYPDVYSWVKEDTSEPIPSEFFAEILSIRATTPDSLRFWRISEMVLLQVLTQLDSNSLGMSVTFAQCMPPLPGYDNKVCSLRERAGRGTYPWPSDLEPFALFLGAESLGGYVAESGRAMSIDDLSDERLLPAYQSEFEVSAAAHPIMLGERVAGILSVSSTQPGYFTPERMALLVTFSDIASLAFNKDEFYPLDMIELKVMPEPEKQRPIIATFRPRVARAHLVAARQRRHINNLEAEQQVWREIERELISLSEDEG